MPARITSILLILALLAGGTRAARAKPAHGTTAPPAISVTWLRVDARQPRTLYVGGTLCAGPAPCHEWVERSTDGGATWSWLSAALGLESIRCAETVGAFLVADPGRLYAEVDENCGSPNSTSSGLLRSYDGGAHWTAIGQRGTYGGGYSAPALSAAQPGLLYAVAYAGGGPDQAVAVSRDGGAHWREGGNPVPSGAAPGAFPRIASLVPDTRAPDTLYANLARADADGKLVPALVARSLDAGLTWTAVLTPTISPPLATFSVSADPLQPGLLIGRSVDPGVPSDRCYLSRDGGLIWRAGLCLGDLHGTCPSAVVANTFGAGASYALVGDGVYRIGANGAASSRLPIRLPLAPARIIAAGAGTRAGDPIYLLGQGVNGSVHGLLYRSSDQGKTWTILSAGLLPNLAPPSTASGALLVRPTRHSVAPPFVATYRRLGPLLIGYPVTEAYYQGDTLVQDFEHLRLELHSGRVVIGDLGSAVFLAHLDQGDPALDAYQYGEGAVGPVANGPTVHYVPSTRHTIRGALLRFWEAHGGMAVFGAPLTEVFRSANGDGSGQVYAMQYFQHARLELHPENRDPRYAVLLGLLGPESLAECGWVTPR